MPQHGRVGLAEQGHLEECPVPLELTVPRELKHSPNICCGLIQTVLEQGESLEHLQYMGNIIVWGDTAAEVFEKGEKIIQIPLKASFAINESKVKGPAQRIQFLGIKWHSGHRQIPMDVTTKWQLCLHQLARRKHKPSGWVSGGCVSQIRVSF